MKTTTEQINKMVNSIINDNHISAEITSVSEDYVTIYVDNGDWKHDHRLLKNKMKENGFLLIDEHPTKEDGSDCYSSEHAYIAKDSDQIYLYPWLNVA